MPHGYRGYPPGTRRAVVRELGTRLGETSPFFKGPSRILLYYYASRTLSFDSIQDR